MNPLFPKILMARHLFPTLCPVLCRVKKYWSDPLSVKKDGGVEKEKLAIYVPMIYIQPRTVRNAFDAVRYITGASGGEGVGPREMESRLSRALWNGNE